MSKAKKKSWEEIVLIADKAYTISDEDWEKEYGDKQYWQVIKEKVNQVRQEAIEETIEAVSEVIGEVQIQLVVATNNPPFRDDFISRNDLEVKMATLKKKEGIE